MNAPAPVRFADVLGQDHARRLLEGMVTSDRFPSALLFVGPASVGKRMTAKALAWAAGCRERSACGHCPGCAANAYGEGLREIDLGAVFADDQVKVKVEALRAFLADQASAHALPRRLAIIDRAELLNDAMQGSLLKAIEEPPERVTYVLVAESAAMLATTIRSRALTIRFRPLGPGDLASILASGDAAGTTPVPLDLLEAAQGSVSRARALRAEYAEVSELVADVLGKNPPRGARRAEVQERLALAIPAAASLHPGWREALLALDAAVASNAHLGLAWSVFRATADASDSPRRTEEPWRAARDGSIARRLGGSNMDGETR